MPKYRTIPEPGKEIFAENSSLAVGIDEDEEHVFGIHIWNRRTNSIISRYRISLLEHCRKSLLEIDPIPKMKKRKFK